MVEPRRLPAIPVAVVQPDKVAARITRQRFKLERYRRAFNDIVWQWTDEGRNVGRGRRRRRVSSATEKLLPAAGKPGLWTHQL